MASDCTFSIDGGLLNIRVGAIIRKGEEFLMVGNDQADYVYSVGGRIQFGENAEQAVVREVFEETGVRMEIDRLGFVHETFFMSDDPARKNCLIYEISFYFYMKTPVNFEPICKSVTDRGSQEKLVWVSADREGKIYPEFFRTELKNPCDTVKYIRTDERK